MKKLVIALLTALCLMVAVCAMAEVEQVHSVAVTSKVSLTDYGFCGEEDGEVTLYGNTLDKKEARAANLGTPCVYFTFTNKGTSDAHLKLYIRGGKKYDCYWSTTLSVPAGGSKTFIGSGYKKASLYAGNWSIAVNNKKTIKVGLYAD